MNILCDYHHAGLYNSIASVFEKRLGHLMYRPIGLEWATMGIWQYSEALATQRQYLDLIGCELQPGGYYTQFENSEGLHHRLLTFEQFEKIQIDIIIGSCSQHEVPFCYLQKRYKPEAKFIRVTGNSGEPMDWGVTQNLIDTTNLYPSPEGVNRVVVHQEFNINLFNYEPPKQQNIIKTFVNCFDESPHYNEYLAIKEALKEYQWKEHGHHGKDGFVTPVAKLAEAMKEASFILHIKSHGEGYGHIIHNAFSVGRPIITIKKYYEGKMAESLIRDGYTAVCIDNLSMEKVIEKVKYYSDPEKHKKLCDNASAIFKKNVNFEEDGKKVEEFLKKLN